MYLLHNDYSEGAHPQVLDLLNATNLEQTMGYGEDHYSEQARELLRRQISCSQAAIYFLPGGTLANLILIAAALRPHEAVVAAESGHIEVHESGAIEACGHKILALPTSDGKLSPQLLAPVLAQHNNHHMVKPRLVYISNSTELGTIYTKEDLCELYAFCQANNLRLYLDGARLGAALVAPGQNLQLADVASYTDAFTIGGGKNGALMGEALVVINKELQCDLPYIIKQRGGLFFKGRLLALQFIALFRDDLYLENARHANRLALYLKAELQKRAIPFLTDSPTNQQFPIFPKPLAQSLIAQFQCAVEKEWEDHLCIRVITSWATQQAALDSFLAQLPACE